MKSQNIKMKSSLIQDYDVLERLGKQNEHAKNQSSYILNYANCPIYENTYNEYLSPGEVKFERLVKEFKKSKTFYIPRVFHY